MKMNRKVFHVYFLLLAVLQMTTTASAQNTDTNMTASAPSSADLGYLTLPVHVTVAVGEPAEFRCGVPLGSPNLTFIIYRSHGNYSIICPKGHMEDIPQALYGSCDMKNGESLAVWTLKGTSFSDNGTRVVCQQYNNPASPAAFLHVYDSGLNQATVIGIIIGAFFGVMLVAILFYITLLTSENFRKCFRGKEIQEDMTEIISDD